MSKKNQNKKQDGFLADLVPVGGTPGDPFPMKLEDLKDGFIESAPSTEEGLVSVRKHYDQVYRRKHGQWKRILEHAIEATDLEFNHASEMYVPVLRLLEDVPATLPQDAEELQMPTGRKRWAVHGLAIVCTVLAVLTCWNVARFAVSETQGWTLAFVYSGVFAFVALILKYIYDKTTGWMRTATNGLLVGVGITSGCVFLWTLACRFAFTPSPTQLEQNPALAFLGLDMRCQLISQTVLEILLGVAAFNWRRSLFLPVAATKVENPAIKVVAPIAVERSNPYHTTKGRRAQLVGLLDQWESSRQLYIDDGEAYWRALQQDREDDERKRRKREAERQEEDRQYEERHRQRFARWQTAPSNGTNHQSKIIKL